MTAPTDLPDSDRPESDHGAQPCPPLACAAIGLAALLALPGGASAVDDPRFFGSFCGGYRETVTVPVLVWPLPPIFVPRDRHLDFTVEAQSDHRTTPDGNGLINGSGEARVESTEIPEVFGGVSPGDVFPFVFSGTVTARGVVAGSGVGVGREPTRGSMTLSTDGLEVTVRAMERELRLRKDACGNSRRRRASTCRPTRRCPGDG